MRLIDADALEESLVTATLEEEMKEITSCYCYPCRKIIEAIDNAPTIEDTEAKCSCCGFETLVDQPGNGLHMVGDLHYCPHCCAKMEKKEDEKQ